MIKFSICKFLFIFFIILSLFFNDSFSNAQTEESEIEIGGQANCRFSGGLEKFKKLNNSIENSFVINSGGNNIEFTIDGEFSNTGKNETLSLHLSAPVPNIDIDSLLAGERISSQSQEAELSVIKSTDKEDIEILNLSSDDNDEGLASTVLIQIKKIKKNLATGVIKIRFPKTTRFASDNLSNEELESDNGKVVVNCDFRSVPISNINNNI